MKAKVTLIAVLILLSFGSSLFGQTKSSKENSKQKTVLLINTHLTYPGWSEGKLNASFYNVAKEFFISKNYRVLETKVEDGYNADEEVEKHLQADIVILQTPVNWENAPWIYKKYVDEVFNTGMFSQTFLTDDGRTRTDPTKQYGTGGKMQGKQFMVSATWNAPKEAFGNPNQYLLQGKTTEDIFLHITTNYRFCGVTVLEAFNCFDVMKNPQIESDLKRWKERLETLV